MTTHRLTAPTATTGAFSCPLCGSQIDPAQDGACQSCPLHQGCTLVCCPTCGYSTIAPNTSFVERWLSRVLKKDKA